MFRVKNTKAQGEIESIRRQPKLDKKWDSYFKQLIKYKEESKCFFHGSCFHCYCFVHVMFILFGCSDGDCLVPKIYKKNRPLASW